MTSVLHRSQRWCQSYRVSYFRLFLGVIRLLWVRMRMRVDLQRSKQCNLDSPFLIIVVYIFETLPNQTKYKGFFLECVFVYHSSSLLIAILTSHKLLLNHLSLSAMSSIQHIVLLGSFSNLFLATSKFLAGWYYESNALAAEGWHSISDLAMDAVTAFTVFLSSQFCSKKIPGSRYIEDAGSLVISSVLCVGGFRTLCQSWRDLITSVPGVDRQLPGIGALWIPLITIITKETVYNISQ